MFDNNFDYSRPPPDLKSFQRKLKTELGLSPDNRWSVPCFRLPSLSDVPLLVNLAQDAGLPISVDIGMGTNALELIDLGEEMGGMVLGVDNDFFPHGYHDTTTGNFVVVIAEGEASGLPTDFADKAQVLFPTPESYIDPIFKAADALKKGGELFLAFDPTVKYAQMLYKPEDLLEYITHLITSYDSFNARTNIVDWEDYNTMHPRSPIHQRNLSSGHRIPIIEATKL